MHALRVCVATVVFTFVCSAAVPARAAAACGTSGYAYAGLGSNNRAFGVAAQLTTLTAPQVLSGHVAAWVGFGGPGAGPNGSDEWIQVGYSGFPGSYSSNLYYEVARPNHAPEYREIASGLAPGTTRKVAVAELAGRRGWWRVWVDNIPVGSPVYLPGSHGAWRPIVTAEAWGAGSFVCNRFRYRFHALSVATRVGGSWLPLRGAYTFEDHGYRIARSGRGYVVSNG